MKDKDYMRYKIGQNVFLKDFEKLNMNPYTNCNGTHLNPVAFFFRGKEVEIVKIYTSFVVGYGVKYKGSREFFISEEWIERD